MGDPMADFEPRQIINIGGQTLRYEREDDGTKLMHEVYITHPDGTIIYAQEGEFIARSFFQNKMLLSFRLTGVTIEGTDRKKPEELLRTQAPAMIQTFAHNFDQSGEIAKTASNMTISELHGKIQRDNEARVRQIDDANGRIGVFRDELDKEQQKLENIYNQDPSIPENQRRANARGDPVDTNKKEEVERRVTEIKMQIENQEKRITDLRTSKSYVIPEDLYEFHKKFAIPFACLVFTIVGAPMGMFSRRSGKSMGFGYAIIILVIYYVLLTLGQGWAISGTVNPVFSAWMPDIFLGALGLFLVIKKLRE
jgi:lipopolysaccharide export LptBFGC system permease protein LptF